jgi:hypothetical protein
MEGGEFTSVLIGNRSYRAARSVQCSLLDQPEVSARRIVVGSEEARREALASVRRPNCTCGSPACSFHEDT